MSGKCPNCGKYYHRKCLVCGYDPATGKFKVSRKKLGLPDEDPGPFADIWIGNFADEDLYGLDFEELEEYEPSDSECQPSYDFLVWPFVGNWNSRARRCVSVY
jgi:hypothetical protein